MGPVDAAPQASGDPLRIFSPHSATEKSLSLGVGRSHIPLAASRLNGGHRPRGGRRGGTQLAEVRPPSWQTVGKYLLRVCAGPAL